ncbi:MAG: RNA-dependent ATPase [Vezdaea aestivalis]|nr:MAG: RNA-dependent ATPase [Vezdaea aestivalis]
MSKRPAGDHAPEGEKSGKRARKSKTKHYGKPETAEDVAERKRLKSLRKAEKKAKKREKAEAQVNGAIDEEKANGDGEEQIVSNGTVQLSPKSTPAISNRSASLYTQSAELSSLPQSEIDAFLTEKQIAFIDPTPQSPPLRPIISFSHLPAPAQSSIFSAFTAPTPIQAASWPHLIAGRDIIGVAETGSGKTLAFAVPCLQHITSSSARSGVKAVVVSPTRELALQIHAQFVQLADPIGLKCVCVYGGVGKDEQRRLLTRANVVVATPGRLNDFINDGSADISGAEYVVLDEADRMLDKGFEADIKKILSKTLPSPKRQTLMFTATWPESVRKLAASFMNNPVRVHIGEGNPQGDLRANTSIKQVVEVMEPFDKEKRLLKLINQHQQGGHENDKILIFCLYKKEAKRVCQNLKYKGFSVGEIHGDLGQEQRTESLNAFKQGDVTLLVATDVAARGLDIPAVKLVINNTFPLTVEDYVHRIGRTGRAGSKGLAITFFTEQDKGLSGGLINVLKAANQQVPSELLKFGGTVKKKGHEAYGAFFKDTDNIKAATKIKFDD